MCAEGRNKFCIKFFADSLVHLFRKDYLPEVFCEPRRSSAGEHLLLYIHAGPVITSLY